MSAGASAPRRAVLGLGTNLGSREALLRAAADLIAASAGITLRGCSRAYVTAPLGPGPQPDYLNAAVLVETALAPHALLAAARAAEARLGRERRARWAARTIDVDVLWIEGVQVADEALRVPHAELANRAFALAPLCELVPDARDPASGRAYRERLAELPAASSEAPLALGAGLAIEPIGAGAAAGFAVRARDRADALAGAAEALCAREREARASACAAVEARASGSAGGFADDGARARAWLQAVARACDAQRLAVRRAVVLADDADVVRGVLVGETAGAAACEAREELTRAGVDAGPAARGKYEVRVARER